jgi:hypothetical protein
VALFCAATSNDETAHNYKLITFLVVAQRRLKSGRPKVGWGRPGRMGQAERRLRRAPNEGGKILFACQRQMRAPVASCMSSATAAACRPPERFQSFCRPLGGGTSRRAGRRVRSAACTILLIVMTSTMMR